MFNDPRMTSNGRRIAFLIALALVLFLPKQVDRGRHPGKSRGEVCTVHDLVPLGIYGIEQVFGTTGVRYSHDEECR
jgi:hypothetical protein